MLMSAIKFPSINNSILTVLAVFLFSGSAFSANLYSTDYSSLQAALDSALDGDLVLVPAGFVNEDIYYTKPNHIKINGGYDSLYQSVIGQTIIRGMFKTRSGRLTVKALKVSPSTGRPIIISNVSVSNVGTSSLMVSFKTNYIAASSVVSSLANSSSVSNTRNHSLMLNGLVPGQCNSLTIIASKGIQTGSYPASMLCFNVFDISLHSSGLYSLAVANGFSDIFASMTYPESVPDLVGGSGNASINYSQAISDPFQSLPVLSVPYIVSSSGVSFSPSRIKADYSFALPSPVPLWSTDVYLSFQYQQVYGLGLLFVTGYKDISEPTPIDVYNDTDRTCYNSAWLPSGSPDMTASFDKYSHNIRNIKIKLSDALSPQTVTPALYNLLYGPVVAPASFYRLGYVLSDYQFHISFLEDWINTTQSDTFVIPSQSFDFVADAVKNQNDIGGRTYPEMFSIRGNLMWWGAGLIYDNQSYPINSVCTW